MWIGIMICGVLLGTGENEDSEVDEGTQLPSVRVHSSDQPGITATTTSRHSGQSTPFLCFSTASTALSSAPSRNVCLTRANRYSLCSVKIITAFRLLYSFAAV